MTQEGGRLRGADLPEERRWASVLFVDIAGFTALSERLDPEDVMDLAQACVAHFSAVVTRFGGSVIREFGDEVLAVFGAPTAHEDDAERAVRAALAMRESLPSDFAGSQLQVHIGINTGELVAGVVGGAERRDYTVHGDTVNTAARLRSAAPPGAILVGEETCRATRRAVRYRAVPPLGAKGKERPVRAWEALEVAAVPEARPLGAAPLTGRDHELAVLSDLWAKVSREERPHLVTVLGEPGIGKSRLVAEFERRALGGAVVLHGRCLPYGEALGFWAFAAALKELAAVSAEDDANEARARLDALVEHVLRPDSQPDEVAEVARHLALVCGLDLPADRGAEGVRQHMLHLSARRFLEALARERAVCLVLEDIHWADDALLDLIEFVASRATDVPLMFVTQARPELLDKRPTWGRGVRGFTSLPLEPLGFEEASALVRALCHAHGLGSELVDQLGHGAGGNPLFAEELVATVAERGDLGGVPSVLKGLISARLDGLPPDERKTLQLAAVCGKVFWEGALRVLGAPGDLALQLDALEYKMLVRPRVRSQIRGERPYMFKHDLIRDVAYQTLPRAVRRTLHGRLADWLEQASGERADEYLDLLAHHAVQAEQQERGLDYLVRAAERARRAGALREEAALLAQAIGIAEGLGRSDLTAELRARRGRALFRSGLWAQARADLELALDGITPEQAERRSEVLIDVAMVCHWVFDVPSVRRFAQEALALARRCAREDLTAGAEGALAFAETSDGNMSAGVTLFDRAVARSRDLPSEVLGPTVEYSGLVLYFLGQTSIAIERGQQAYHIAQSAQDTATMIRALGNLGTAQTALGHYDDALSTFEEARRVASEHGVTTWLARAIAMCGGLHLALSDFAAAQELAEEARELARSSGFVLPVASAGIDLLLNFARRGEPGRALALVNDVGDAVEAGQGAHGWIWRMRYTQARAEIALAQGDCEATLRWSADALDQSRARGRIKYQSAALQTRALALAAQGQTRAAITCLRRAVDLARRLGDPALFLQAASNLLVLDGDESLAREAVSSIEGMLARVSDDRLRQHLVEAEPVRRVLAFAGSAADRDDFQVVARDDDRLVI